MFALSLDYRAPEGGVLAGLIGADAGYRAQAKGAGSWSDWRGNLRVRRAGERFASLRLTQREGRFGVRGRVYPAPLLQGLALRAAGPAVGVAAAGRLEDSVLDGAFALTGRGLRLRGEGAVDLDGNRFDDLAIAVSLRDPALLGGDVRLNGAQLAATLDGPFRDLRAAHRLRIDRADLGTIRVAGLRQQGTARYDGARWRVPLDATVARITSGEALLDPRLYEGRFAGMLTVDGDRLASDALRFRFPGSAGEVTLRADLSDGAYAVAGPVSASRVALANLGLATGRGRVVFRRVRGGQWDLRAAVAGQLVEVTNGTLRNLAGAPIRFDGGLVLGRNRPLAFNALSLDAPKVSATLDGQLARGTTTLAGTGRHVDYGPFTVEGTLTPSGPRAVLVFADPFPAAGLTDVRVALSPTADGFAIETRGQSRLGPFSGTLDLVSRGGGPTRIDIGQLDVAGNAVTGSLVLGQGALSGGVRFAGGGLDGTIALSPREGGQSFTADVTARNARFAGATPIAIASGTLNARGLLKDGSNTIEGTLAAQGVTYGSLFLGRVAANAALVDGSGRVSGSLTGRRGSRFALQAVADVAPSRIAAVARGRYAGEPIVMPRRAVLTKRDDGGWALARTQVSYGDGVVLVDGTIGGNDTALNLRLADMPLTLADAVADDLGLGGKLSGLIEFRTGAGGLPVGSAKVTVDDLSRSGLVLTSQPVDLALVARLTERELQTRAVIEEAGGRSAGRLQGRIANLAPSGGLIERLERGSLAAQLRYRGPASALWRLAAVEAFDMTGPVAIGANATGTLADPQVRGTVASDALRVRSAISGTDISDITLRGRFAGSRLQLSRYAGRTPGGGTISGSGVIDIAGLGRRGPRLDLRASARNARLVAARGLGATVTGPLRIVSDGVGGTIAGRVRIDRASWRLGRADEEVRLPRIATREINLPPDIRAARARGRPWRYLIDAVADDRVAVDGLGLDSEWAADIVLRGTTDDPRIGGVATVVQGDYTFAGTQFELQRGRIDFDANQPIDPRLDILATSEGRQGLDVTVRVSGTAQQPEIAFDSTPQLPEEEILARLLFGGSITELSATDALQLGAAVAALQGDGGLDPINQLRSAIGLDRLRIVGPDPAIDRGTAVALGENLGRRFYVELITDGQNYSATSVEFRVTSWLSLLASVSTVGREGVSAEVRRDY